MLKDRSNNKKGVSLVTVLLFMLVASIAATATYKWLSSQNSTSASRMRQSEAYQAARAGIENAKTWMTFNGNATGAVIKQFLDYKNAGQTKPINISTLLKSVDGNADKSIFGLFGKQSAEVYVTDVDVSGATYKVKVVSVGKERFGSEHKEVAVFNVSGLYRVKLPVTKGTLNFHYPYFGGSLVSNKSELTSAIVNGNLEMKEPNGLYEDLIVTGNLVGTRGSAKVASKTCVGGNFSTGSEQSGLEMKDLFVGGDYGFSNEKNITGDAYFNGNLTPNTNNAAGFVVGGNVTLNGRMTWQKQGAPSPWGGFSTIGNAKKIKVEKNLCLSNTAVLDIGIDPSSEQSDNPTLEVSGDVYIPNSKSYVIIDRGGANATHHYMLTKPDPDKDFENANGYKWIYKHIMLGSQNTSTLYLKDYQNFKDKKWVLSVWPQTTQTESCEKAGGYYCVGLKTGTHNVESGKDAWLYNVFSTKAANIKPASDESPIKCAEGVKEFCDDIWHEVPKGTGCDGANYAVDDPLVTAYNTFKAYADKGCATQDNVKNLEGAQACYDNSVNNVNGNSSKNLYNGFLVINVDRVGNINSELKGKYILIFENKADIKLDNLGSTGASDLVVLYFKQGANINFSGTDRRYFIYSEGPVTGTGNATIKGSFYSPSSMCNDAKADIPNVTINFDQTVLDDLVDAAIVCSSDDSDCGGDNSSTPTPGEGGTASGNSEWDSHYVAVGPQLNVTVLSQYQNNESVAGAETAGPSLVVMPRIVYLHEDAPGKLKDYYSVLKLNRAQDQFDPSEVQCVSKSGVSIPTGDRVLLESGNLKKGLYNCTYKGDHPFYVYVKDAIGMAPNVQFKEFSGSDPHTLSLEPGNANEAFSKGVLSIFVPDEFIGDNVTVDVYVSQKPSSWGTSVSPVSGNITWIKSTDYMDVYRVNVTGKGTIPVFTFDFKDNASAETNTMRFELHEPCDGCMISSPSAAELKVEGKVTVKREEVSAYCTAYPGDDRCMENAEFDLVEKRPSCPESATEPWVTVGGDGVVCSNSELNKTWYCSNSGTMHLTSVNVNSLCEAILIDAIKTEDQEVTLYGSLKRKPVTLTVNFDGSESGSEVWVVNCGESGIDCRDKTVEQLVASSAKVAELKKNDNVYEGAYAGLTYKLVAKPKGDDYFSYWDCAQGSCMNIKGVGAYINLDQGEKGDGNNVNVTPDGNMTVVAKFNQKDKHCFYDDFNGMSKHCSGGNISHADCIDVCKTDPGVDNPCDIDGGKYGETKNWLLMYNNSDDGKRTTFPHVNNGVISRPSYNAASVYEKGGEEFGLKWHVLIPFLEWKPAGGRPSLILNRSKAGKDGVLSSVFETDNISYLSKISEDLGKLTGDEASSAHRLRHESGFVFRSNRTATDYMTFHVYGYGSKLLGISGAGIFGKICKVSSSNTPTNMVQNHASQCTEPKTFTSGNSKNLNVNIEGLASKALVLNLKINGSKVEAQLTISQSLDNSDDDMFMNFDLEQEFGVGGYFDDADHEYVGFKLASPGFKLRDLGWSTSVEEYRDEGCFANPELVCSFSQNYPGGRVPDQEEVSPWYVTSAFKMSSLSSCQLSMYYNGCDNETSSPTPRHCSNSYYGEESVGLGELVNGMIFRFNGEPGVLHGKDTSFIDRKNFFGFGLNTTVSGRVRDAKIKLDCPKSVDISKIPASLFNPKSCGAFIVGPEEKCTENVNLIGSSTQVSSDGIEISLAKAKNLRSSNIFLEFSRSGVEGAIRFKDVLGNYSEIQTISTGDVSVETFNMDDVQTSNFDPQQVASFVISVSGESAELEKAESACPYVMGVHNCSISYDGKSWNVKADITNGKKCRIVSKGNNKSNLSDFKPESNAFDCIGVQGQTINFNKNYLESAVMTSLNPGDSKTYEFEFQVFDPNDEDSAPEPCDMETVVNGYNATCSIDQSSVLEGRKPKMTYSFDECPSSGCPAYRLRVNNVPESDQSFPEKSTNTEWTPVKPIPVGTNYRYEMLVGEKTICQTETFDVVKAQPATVSCWMDGSTYYADVNAANDGSEWTLQLAITDPNGNIIDLGDATGSSGDHYSKPIDFNVDGVYLINTILNGVVQQTPSCGTLQHVEGSSITPISLTGCPSSVDAGSDYRASVSATLSGCDEGLNCTYSVDGSGSVAIKNGQSFVIEGSASYAGSSKEHTIVVSKNGAQSQSCKVSVNYPAMVSDVSAKCEFSKSTMYVGENVTINVSDIRPAENVELEYLIGDNSQYKELSYWGPNGFSKDLKIDNVGDYTLVLKINQKRVCSHSITVKNYESNVLDVKSGIDNPEANTDFILHMPTCGTVQFSSNSANCRYTMNGKEYTFGYHTAIGVSGDFSSGNTFNNTGNCVTRISCY